MKISNTPKKGFFYSISMFLYPSGMVHLGHARNLIGEDIFKRYLMLKGYDVESYLGWDSFGAPAEYAAVERGMDPKKWTYENIAEMNKVIKKFDNYYHESNYTNQLICSDKSYYTMQRVLFLKLFQAGLIYKKESYVNWDSKFNTVLANEQVDANGISWRSGIKAERRKLSQWFMKITSYAEELLSDLQTLDWPSRIINAQISWIGKSEGYIYKFPVRNSHKVMEIFTTQPQTIEGCTFIAISKESDYMDWFDLKDGKVGECIYKDRFIPIYVADYVLNYGTGAVMGVPNADERDRKFAKENNIPILNYSYIDKEIFVKDLTPVIQYRLKDWCISRQRSWGCPIPIIYCDKCGVVEDQIDIDLPSNLDFTKEGNPLNHCSEYVNVKCSKCGGNARRETDTMDTFVDSSWYYLRYLNHMDNTQPFNKNTSVPVDLYIGGAEHATAHLLYARFITKAFADLGLLNFREPFKKLINQGMVLSMAFQDEKGLPVYSGDVVDKDGKYYNIHTKKEVYSIGIHKMSKSLKNTTNPTEILEKCDVEVLRFFIASEPIEVDMIWNLNYLNGCKRFINDINNMYERNKDKKPFGFDEDLFVKANNFLQKYQEEMDSFKANCAIASIRSLFNILKDREFTYTFRWAFGRLLVSLSPILINTCPFIYEQMFKKNIYELGFHNDEWGIIKDNNTVKLFINDRYICDMENGKTKEEMIEIACKKHNISSYKNIIYVEKKVLKIIK